MSTDQTSTDTVSDPTLRKCTDQELKDEVEARGLEDTWKVDEPNLFTCSDAELTDEYENRFGAVPDDVPVLGRIYETFRSRGDAPPELRNYLEERIGRILP
jgi:hypothetical protein